VVVLLWTTTRELVIHAIKARPRHFELMLDRYPVKGQDDE